MYQTDFGPNQIKPNQTKPILGTTKPSQTEHKWFGNEFKKYQTEVNGLGHDLGLKSPKPTHVQPYHTPCTPRLHGQSRLATRMHRPAACSVCTDLA